VHDDAGQGGRAFALALLRADAAEVDPELDMTVADAREIRIVCVLWFGGAGVVKIE